MTKKLGRTELREKIAGITRDFWERHRTSLECADQILALFAQYAEGIVVRPLTELQSRSGHRIIGKIKTRDFK